jgi:hypothetical protein
MFVLRRPLIGMTLEHGNFDVGDAVTTSRALAGFSLGLIGFSVYLFVLRAFFAHEDARTPFVINVFENLINIVLAVVLAGRYGVLGLGASFAIAYTVSSVFALHVLSYKVRGFSAAAILGSLWRMALAGVVMAEVMWVVARFVGRRGLWLPGPGDGSRRRRHRGLPGAAHRARGAGVDSASDPPPFAFRLGSRHVQGDQEVVEVPRNQGQPQLRAERRPGGPARAGAQ